MRINEAINRINRMHTMIQKRRTGSPKELANKLNLSVSAVYRHLSFMKNCGAPIAYCRKDGTYFYQFEVDVSIFFGFNP